MDYTITFEATPLGRLRYENCLLAIRARGGSEKTEPSFEDHKKEGRLLRAFRAIGLPKDWIADVRKQLADTSEGRNREQLQKLLERMERGDDPRVAEPEDGLPETRDFVLRTQGGAVTLDFDDRELLVKYLKATRWQPDYAQFGTDLVAFVLSAPEAEKAEKTDIPDMGKRPHRVKAS